MADLRRHLTTRPGRGYTRQLTFLELCPTCNDDFIDREVFESQHGYRGEHCNNRQPQRRRANAQVQWELLYRQVEATMISQHAQTRMSSLSAVYKNITDVDTQEQNNDSSALPVSSASIPTPPVSHNDVIESPGVQHLPNQQERAMPYLTPYELIVDSDSDEEQPMIELQNVSVRYIKSIACLIDSVSRLLHLCLVAHTNLSHLDHGL
jgi:hypothetical protein